jgi:hypothetical protein
MASALFTSRQDDKFDEEEGHKLSHNLGDDAGHDYNDDNDGAEGATSKPCGGTVLL